MTKVICGFPGIGKSTVVKESKDHGLKLLDSDSSAFPKDAFPENYINHIKEKTSDGYTILASSHDSVRNALTEAGIPFVIFMPHVSALDEYVRRYRKRGSPESFINTVSSNWRKWLEGCAEQGGTCIGKVILPGNYYLSLDLIRQAGISINKL